MDQAPHILTEAKALAALANPHRTRIIDVLRVHGPSTASTLATHTDQAVGSTSHHLKVLAEAKIVEEAPELAKDRRERWWRLAAPSTRWSRADFADDPAAVSAARAAENLHLARQFERARAFQDDPHPPPGWDDTGFAAQSWLRMTPAELDELSDQLVELITSWANRAIPDDGQQREPVLVFARGFPAQP